MSLKANFSIDCPFFSARLLCPHDAIHPYIPHTWLMNCGVSDKDTIIPFSTSFKIVPRFTPFLTFILQHVLLVASDGQLPQEPHCRWHQVKLWENGLCNQNGKGACPKKSYFVSKCVPYFEVKMSPKICNVPEFGTMFQIFLLSGFISRRFLS